MQWFFSSFHPLARDKIQCAWNILNIALFFLFMSFYSGTAGMPGPVEGRLAALPDAILGRLQHQGTTSDEDRYFVYDKIQPLPPSSSLSPILLPSTSSSTLADRSTQLPAGFPAGPERRCHLQRIDVAYLRRLSHSQTHTKGMRSPR